MDIVTVNPQAEKCCHHFGHLKPGPDERGEALTEKHCMHTVVCQSHSPGYPALSSLFTLMRTKGKIVLYSIRFETSD